MAQCECLTGCPFFNDRLPDMPAASKLFKQQYCRGDKESCARYKVRQELGPQAVPRDLFPNQTERAIDLIAAASETPTKRSP